MRSACMRVFVAALALAFAGRALAHDHGQIAQLNNGCRDQLNSIWEQHYSLPITDGQYDCKQLLSGALNNTNGIGCPPYDNMIGCILVVPSAWISLYSNCSTLFSPPSNCVLNGFTGSDCKRPQYQSNDLLVAQGGETYSVNSYQYDTGILDNNGPGWQTQFYVGEDADRRRRALMQVEDNEGGGGGSGLDAGCWPDFYDVSDFTQWLDGVYQEPFYGGNSINPVGVIFWALQGLGILSMALM